MKRRKITHWRFWALLINEEKVMLYPSLSKSEKKRIWTDMYMKVVKLNTYPHAFKEKYDAKFEILNQIKGEKNE